jgi:hypothetical protein
MFERERSNGRTAERTLPPFISLDVAEEPPTLRSSPAKVILIG